MYGENLDRFDLFHDFGVRIIQLTYNRRNLMGDGCLEPGNAGLSKLGHAMVDRMNERGVLLDLSHCGQRTTRVLTWTVSGKFFDAASPHCRLQPVRSAIRKDRRR